MQCTADGRRTEPAIPLTTTIISNEQQREQQEITFQTWSSTSFDDDGHHTDMHSSDTNSGGAATIGLPTRQRSNEYYNYPEVNRATVDDGAVEQRQPSLDHYQELLPQPPPPSIYANLSPSIEGRSQDVHVTESGDTDPGNYERLFAESVSEQLPHHEYVNIGGTSQVAGSEAHHYQELITHSQ